MSKAIGRIFGDTAYATKEDYERYLQNFDKNTAKIVPFTQTDGNIGYHLVDKNGFVLYDAGDKDYARNLWEQQNQQSLRPYDNYMDKDERVEQMILGYREQSKCKS